MISQKKRRDILDDLFNTSDDNSPPGTEELEKLIRREHPKKKGKTPHSKRGGKKEASKGKKKTTHYLSGEIFRELDEAKHKINELVPSPLRARVSKSQIVNQALKMILNDFEQKGEKSTLIKQLLNNYSPGTHEDK